MKHKSLLQILSFAVFVILGSRNIALGIETVQPKTNFPDFGYEYVGFDKHEKFNRKMYCFNIKLNDYFVKPINRVWESVLPKYGIEHLQNVSDNVEYPIRLFSCVLQKDFKASVKETKRFFINTTIGVGGFFDIAKKKFKLDPQYEDMGQVLAHYKVKPRSYFVLPFFIYGNGRDLVGKVLDCPLNPSLYIAGPAAAIAKAVLTVNKAAQSQPLLQAINSNFADPYDIAKKLYGVDRYIKNQNLDRKDVLDTKTAQQNIININSISQPSQINPDINLNNYNSQSATIDALRTALFSDDLVKKSMWGDLSIWNRCFDKKIKCGNVSISENRAPYAYRYILQSNKAAPLAFVYPSIGEGRTSAHAAIIAKMLYDNGYSVIIQGSAFQWEFLKSMPNEFKPGIPSEDAKYLRLTSAKILNKLSEKYNIKPVGNILIGTSYGALTGLFVASQEDKENTLNIKKYICLSPPVDILYAAKQIDKYTTCWKEMPGDIKMNTAITAEKVLTKLKENQELKIKDRIEESEGIKNVNFNMTEDEARLITAFVMKQKLSDLVYTIENGDKKAHSKSKTEIKDLYKEINNMDYMDYAKKYLPIANENENEIEKATDLSAISDFLSTSSKYKIYQSINDYYSSPEKLNWLKAQTKNKSVYMNNGSHLGYLYRKEFKEMLNKDIQEALNEDKNDKTKIQLIKNDKKDNQKEEKIELRH